MKKTRTYFKVLLFLLLFKGYVTFGQTRQNSVTENESWSIVNYNPSQGPNCVWQTYEIRLTGDTIINNTKYKIVRQSEFGFQPENWANIGYIREDSTQKVYFKNNLNEVLLYDFDVSTGDTVNITCPFIDPYSLQFAFFNFLQMIVCSVDTVETNDGLKKRISLNPICTSEWTTYWIEGIGDMKGILNSIASVTCSGDSIVGIWEGGSVDDLLCCKRDSSLIFINSIFNTCYYYSAAGIKKPDGNLIELNLYPNPITDISTFVISNPQIAPIHLDIFNLSGEKVKSFVTREMIININRNDFKSGFYFYKVFIDNKLSKCGKLIIR